MQELVGRLSALDPDASESLKVIAYFDTLIEARSGRLALLRAAAVLTGRVAGCRLPQDLDALRVAASGQRLSSATSAGWPGRALAGGGRVWIERSEPDQPVDAMVLERLALAIGLLAAPSHSNAEAVVVDAAASAADRADAAGALRLAPTDQVRAVAVSLGTSGRPSRTSIATPWGSVALHLVRGDLPWPSGAAGIGFAGTPDELPTSWSSAVVALRVRRRPDDVVRADDLGGIVAVVEALDAGAAVPRDVVRVEQLCRDAGVRDLLEAVADTTSLRAAASRLGSHHSTVQARLEAVVRTLGFNPNTPHGRTRLDLAVTVARVRRTPRLS